MPKCVGEDWIQMMAPWMFSIYKKFPEISVEISIGWKTSSI